MNLSQMRTLLRRDLHDEDPANYRWTDAQLDRHIDRAVKELSQASPLEALASLTTTAGSRELALASLTDMVYVEAAEYPTGKYPPSYVQFSLWSGTLTLLIDNTPQAGETVKVYYGKLHTLDTTTSTIPSALDNVVLTGAAAYAALEWASFATNRLNVGGADTWRHYHVWGQERLSRFLRTLANLGRKSSVRVRRLYAPSRSIASQTQVQGPA
jgi:hypothetical protein